MVKNLSVLQLPMIAAAVALTLSSVVASESLGEYDMFPKSKKGLEFPYSPNLVCSLMLQYGTAYGRIEDAYSFWTSPYTPIFQAPSHAIFVACFNYRGYSHVIYKTTSTSSELNNLSTFVSPFSGSIATPPTTHIIRNKDLRSFNFPIIYDIMSFDHLNTKLYAIRNGGDVSTNAVYEIRLPLLEEFWTETDIHLRLKRKNVTTLSPFYTRVRGFSREIGGRRVNDLMVFDDSLFYLLEDGKIWKEPLISNDNSESVQPFDSGDLVFKTEKINFIPFLHAVRLFTMLNHSPDIMKLATPLSPPPPFLIKLPPRPSSSSNSGAIGGWIFLLYLLDIAFAVVLFYVLRKFFAARSINSGISRRRSHPCHDPDHPYVCNSLQRPPPT